MTRPQPPLDDFKLVRFLLAVTMVVSLVTMFGYGFDIPWIITAERGSSMALSTAVCFALLSVSVFVLARNFRDKR